MDEFQRRIDSKLDRISEKLSEIHGIAMSQQVQIDRNTKDLSAHMKRTEINEKSLATFETYIYTMHKTAIRVVAGVLTAAGTLAGIAVKAGWLG